MLWVRPHLVDALNGSIESTRNEKLLCPRESLSEILRQSIPGGLATGFLDESAHFCGNFWCCERHAHVELGAPIAFGNDDLPPSLRRAMPAHAQDIFRNAFNAAWEGYGKREPARREEIAHRVAWAAVKRQYEKVGMSWLPIERDNYIGD
jgi:cation transport regulator